MGDERLAIAIEVEHHIVFQTADVEDLVEGYLTFLGDSLIDKTFMRGSIRDKIPVKLNGEEVYL